MHDITYLEQPRGLDGRHIVAYSDTSFLTCIGRYGACLENSYGPKPFVNSYGHISEILVNSFIGTYLAVSEFMFDIIE